LTQLRNWSQEPAGHIRLSVSEGLSTAFAPYLVGEFRKQSPKVTFEVFSYTQARTFRALEQGETDVALTFDGELSPQIEVLAHEKFRSSALMAPDHPLAAKDSLSVEDLSSYPLATSANTTTRRLLDRVASLGGRRLDVVMTCTNSVAMYNMCSMTQTINVSCYLSYYRFVDLGMIVARDFEHAAQLDRSVMITIMRGRYVPQHLRTFIDFAATQLAEFARRAG
jgi:DNA-binding transcriptional LysR family regulator